MKIIKQEILNVVATYLPQVPKSNYKTANDKSYLQSVYVEAACQKAGFDWLLIDVVSQQNLLAFTHKAIWAQFRTQNKNAQSAENTAPGSFSVGSLSDERKLQNVANGVSAGTTWNW